MADHQVLHPHQLMIIVLIQSGYIQDDDVLYYISLYYLYYIILHYIKLYYIILNYIISYYI